MSPRTGRPKKENPKKVLLQIRIDEATAEDINFCAEKLNTTKSDVVRKGVKKVRSELEAKQ